MRRRARRSRPRSAAKPPPTPRRTAGRKDVDALIIGTPTNTHVDFLLKGARRGKAVLCEKPVDLDIAKAEAAAAEVERIGGKVMVAFNRRFDPSAQEIKRQIDAGTIGEVRQVIITSRDPAPPTATYLATSGGIFRDMTIHDFDMARFFLGEEPVEVMAMASALTEPQMSEAGDFDTMMILMRTASGKQCHINCYRKAVYGYDQRFEVFGSDGMLKNDNLRPPRSGATRSGKPKCRIRSSTSFSSAMTTPTASSSTPSPTRSSAATPCR